MPNEQNLKAFGSNKLTEREQREIQRKGGRASAEARKNKKDLKEALEVLLETEFSDRKGNKKLGSDVIASALFKQASNGNVKAFQTIRDTVGQKPVDKVEVSKATSETVKEMHEYFKSRETTDS